MLVPNYVATGGPVPVPSQDKIQVCVRKGIQKKNSLPNLLSGSHLKLKFLSYRSFFFFFLPCSIWGNSTFMVV